jgi:hypothetical protein
MRTPPLAALLLSSAFALAACSSDDAPAGTTDAGGWPSVHCASSSNTTTADGGCMRSFSGCSDGHSYGIQCAGGSCTCRIDSTATGRATTFDCGTGDLAALAANCDWHQH